MLEEPTQRELERRAAGGKRPDEPGDRGSSAHQREDGRVDADDVYGPVELDWMQARSFHFYDLDANLLEFWSPET